MIVFDEDVVANGLAFDPSLAASEPGREPVAFGLYVADVGSEGGWKLAAASGWRWGATSGLQLLPEEPFVEDGPLEVDMRPPWWMWMAKLVPSVISRPASRLRGPNFLVYSNRVRHPAQDDPIRASIGRAVIRLCAHWH